MRIGIRLYSKAAEAIDILEKAQPDKKGKLEYFRKKILDHLTKLEDEENKAVNKAFSDMEAELKKAFDIGTTRTWRDGKRYKKMPDKKWRPVYEGHTRGAKMAISAIKRKIAAANDVNEMMQIIVNNKERFIDKKGRPLPFVQELHSYIEEQKTVRQPKKQPKGKPQAKEKQQKTENPAWLNEVKEATKRGEKLPGLMSDVEGIKNDISDVEKEIKELEKTGKKTSRWADIPMSPQDVMVELKKEKQELEDSLKFHTAKNNEYEQMLARNKADYEKKTHKPQFSLQELEEGWPKGIFTIEEVAENLKDGDTFQGWPTEIWREAASNGEEYRAEKISGKELKARNEKLFSEENKVKSPETGEKASGDLTKIRDKYKSAKAVEGDEDEIQIGREAMPGRWKLVEADTPTASHDETTFHKTPGFPTNTDGSTINDRDYGHDKAAQDAVHSIGADFDGRALKVDSPVIVTEDGIVISGNNRTMSSKIAARKGTDGKYIEALKKRAKKFGFTEKDISEFKNPRIVFEVEQEGGYSTKQFAKFNESGKKEMGPTEKAVKVSKLIKTETVKDVAEKIGEFDTLGELYADRLAAQHIFNSFKNAGLIAENEIGKYMEEGSITEDGKTFIETALLGSVMSEANIRGFNRPGCKSIRGMLVRAITPLIENKAMSGYSITRELNEAADIAMQVAINRDKFKSVDEFSKQQSMFEKFDPVAVELAKKMEGTQKAFAEFMQNMNGSLKYAANGEADIFLGDVESKEDILGRFLPVKKAVADVLNGIRSFFS